MEFIKKIKKIIILSLPGLFNTLEYLKIGKALRIFVDRVYVEPRANMKLTDTQKLSEHMPLVIYFLSTSEIHKSNDWYGNATVLKRYANLSDDYAIKAAVEHGSAPSNNIFDQDLYSKFPTIITYSKRRADFLEKNTDKRAFAVGPYMYYAPQIQRNGEMSKDGTTLVVFPAHSSDDVKNEYSKSRFCKEINHVSKDFDVTKICLYWKDINAGLDKIYRGYGWECVTAGDVYDPLFLSRLKAIISSATLTMSNMISTHIGYCVLMNKPHFYFKQSVKRTGNRQVIEESRALRDEDMYTAIEREFGKYSLKISDKQRKLVSQQWGFDQIKTPRQLKRVLLECEHLYRDSRSRK